MHTVLLYVKFRNPLGCRLSMPVCTSVTEENKKIILIIHIKLV